MATGIEVRDVSLSFGAGRTAQRVLDNVSFSVAAGEVFGLVGESGSGKSTAAKMLLGLEKLSSGTILVDGKDVSAMNRTVPRIGSVESVGIAGFLPQGTVKDAKDKLRVLWVFHRETDGIVVKFLNSHRENFRATVGAIFFTDVKRSLS